MEEKKEKHKKEEPKNTNKKFNEWLRASATETQGNIRATMEDKTFMSELEYRGIHFYIFLLLDGHGGSDVVEYVHRHFSGIMERKIARRHGRKIREVIASTFHSLNRKIKSRDLKSGTTASLLLIVKRPEKGIETWIANVGDSTVYGISYDQGARKLSLDHNPKVAGEAKRILESGHTISENYVATKEGSMLAVTRALGDLEFQNGGVTSEPTIKNIKTEYAIFALASDGLWDVVKPKDLWDKLNPPRERRKWRDSAYRINTWRNKTYSQHDNSSLILVYVSYVNHVNDVAQVSDAHLPKEVEKVPEVVTDA